MKQRVLFIDLLYFEGGSLDEDMKCITRAAAVDHEVEYIRYNASMGYAAIIKVYFHLIIHRYDKIIFLSAKVSHLLTLIPLQFLSKCYLIYHFMPRHREKFHHFSISFISRFFIIGVYAEGVADKIALSLGYRPPVLPSRIVDRKNSLNKLREKIANKKIHLFVPGVRVGVREFVDLEPIVKKCKDLGFEIDKIFFQGDGENKNLYGRAIHQLGKLPQSEYDQIYDSSLIVAIEFNKNYEVRASGVILDALRSGCLVLSKSQSIICQYGFPLSVVTDLDHLELVLNNINNYSDEDALTLIPGSDPNEFESIWRSFLK